MRCTVCGGDLTEKTTDLPFKLGETSIVILKNLPIFQCSNCREYLLEDAVLGRVDAILSRVDRGAEVEIISYAA